MLELFQQKRTIISRGEWLGSMNERKSDDEELLQRMQDGDEEAFVKLYRRWQAPIFRFAFQMSGSRTAAEDVTQEVFMALIRNSRGYCASRGSFGAWLYGIARHIMPRAISREKTPAVSLNETAREAQIEKCCQPGGDPHDEAVRRQRTERLRKTVLTLPVHYREVLVLCELHEMNYADAATSLGCSIGTVRSRLHRARSMLAERLRSAGFETARPLGTTAPDGCAV